MLARWRGFGSPQWANLAKLRETALYGAKGCFLQVTAPPPHKTPKFTSYSSDCCRSGSPRPSGSLLQAAANILLTARR